MTTTSTDLEKYDGFGDYISWKEKFLGHLKSLDLLEALEEEECKENVSESSGSVEERLKCLEDVEIREEKKIKVRAFIILSVKDHVLRKIRGEETTLGMMKLLDKLYLCKSQPSYSFSNRIQSNRLYLKRKLYEFKMSINGTMKENIEEFLSIVAGLQREGVEMSDETKATILLMSLPKEFDQLKESMKNSEISLTFDGVMRTIYSKENEFDQYWKQAKERGKSLLTKGVGRSDKREEQEKGKKKNRSKVKGKKICWTCNEKGHSYRHCHHEKAKENSGEQSDKPVCKSESANMVEVEVMMQSKDFHKTIDDLRDKWICDTGCTSHMTPRRDWFDDLQMIKPIEVKMANGSISQVKGIGTVRIRNEDGTTVLLTNVNYVPGLSKNLISLGTLENKGCWFKSRGGSLKIIKGCITLLKAQRIGSLYILKNSENARLVNDTVKIKEESSHRHNELVVDIKSEFLQLQKRMYHDNKSCTVLKMSVSTDKESLIVNVDREKHVTEELQDYYMLDQWKSPSVILSQERRSHLRLYEVVSQNTKKTCEGQQIKEMKKLGFDGDVSFCCGSSVLLLKKTEIKELQVCIYTPRPKVVSLGMNNIVEEMKNMSIKLDLLSDYWTIYTALTVRFRSKSSSLESRFEVLKETVTGFTSKCKNLKIGGSIGFVHSYQVHLNSRNKKGVYLDHSSEVNGYKLGSAEVRECSLRQFMMFQEDIIKESSQEQETKRRTNVLEREICSVWWKDEYIFQSYAQGGAGSSQKRNQVPRVASPASDEESKSEQEWVDIQNLQVYQLAKDMWRRQVKSRLNMIVLTHTETANEGGHEPASCQRNMKDSMWMSWRNEEDGFLRICNKDFVISSEEKPKCNVLKSEADHSQEDNDKRHESSSQIGKSVSMRLKMQECDQLGQVCVERTILHKIQDEFKLIDQDAKHKGLKIMEKEIDCNNSDIVIISRKKSAVKLQMDLLSNNVDMKGLEEEEAKFSWLEVNRDMSKEAVRLTQEERLRKTPEMCRLGKSKSVCMQVEMHFKSETKTASEKICHRLFMENASVSNVVRSILNSMKKTRLVLKSAVVVRRFVGSQLKDQKLAVNRTQRKRRSNLQFCLNNKKEDSLELRRFSVSVFANDQVVRKLIFMYMIIAGKHTSQLEMETQESVCLLEKEAEIARRLKGLFVENGCQQVYVEVCCDSRSKTSLLKITWTKNIVTGMQLTRDVIAAMVKKSVKRKVAYHQAEFFTKELLGRKLPTVLKLLKFFQV